MPPDTLDASRLIDAAPALLDAVSAMLFSSGSPRYPDELRAHELALSAYELATGKKWMQREP